MLGDWQSWAFNEELDREGARWTEGQWVFMVMVILGGLVMWWWSEHRRRD